MGGWVTAICSGIIEVIFSGKVVFVISGISVVLGFGLFV